MTVIQEEREETDVDEGFFAAMRGNRDREPLPKKSGGVRFDRMRIPKIVDRTPVQPPKKSAGTKKRRNKAVRKGGAR